MKCSECRGACCENMIIPVKDIRTPNGDAQRWLELHAIKSNGELNFECRCRALTPEGRCGIYDDRPIVCRLFIPGSEDCLGAVKRKRTPEEYAQIRDEEDPVVIHEG